MRPDQRTNKHLAHVSDYSRKASRRQAYRDPSRQRVNNQDAHSLLLQILED